MTVAVGDGRPRLPTGVALGVLTVSFLLTFTWMFVARDRSESTVIFFYGLITAVAVLWAGRLLRSPSVLVLAVSVLCAVPAFGNPYRLFPFPALVFVVVSVFIGWLTIYPARALLSSVVELSFDIVSDAELHDRMTAAMAERAEMLDQWLHANGFAYLGLVRKLRHVDVFQLTYRRDTTFAQLGVLPATGLVLVEFMTTLEERRGLLSTAPVAGFYKVDQVLLQHVHHAGPDQLWPLHEEALRRVTAAGIAADVARPELVAASMGLFLPENRALVLKRPLRFGWFRRRYARTGQSLYDGPVWEQRDFEKRIAAIKAAAARP